MKHATRGRIAAAAFAISMLVAGCGGASDPTPQPTLPQDVAEDATQQPGTGFSGAIDRAKGVAGDLEARNDALDN